VKRVSSQIIESHEHDLTSKQFVAASVTGKYFITVISIIFLGIPEKNKSATKQEVEAPKIPNPYRF